MEDYAKWLAKYVWDSYTSRFGHPPKKISRIELENLTRFFVNECGSRGIDPESVDFLHRIFEDASYSELKDKVQATLNLIRPVPPKPVEIGLEQALHELEKLGFTLKTEEIKKIEQVQALEEKIARLKRNIEKLQREVAVEKARREAAEKALPTAPKVQPTAEEKELLWSKLKTAVLSNQPKEAAAILEELKKLRKR